MIDSPRSLSAKHIPQRTCVACRQVRAKRELVRLVHTPDGNIEIDSDGRKAGRGAYLCRRWECWETGLKGNQLERSLRSNLTLDNRQRLINYTNELLKGVN